MERGAVFLLALVLLFSLSFSTSADNASFTYPTPAEVEEAIQQSEPPQLEAPWGGSLEADLERGGSWSSYDYHITLPPSVATSFISFIESLSEEDSSLIDALGDLFSGLFSEPIIIRSIDVRLPSNLVRGFWTYEDTLENGSRYHILYHTQPSYTHLKGKEQAIEDIVRQYAEVVSATTQTGVLYTPETARKLQEAILSIRGEAADEYYSRYGRVVNALGLEPIICTREIGNDTDRYVCAFKVDKEAEDLGPIPYDIVALFPSALGDYLAEDFMGEVALIFTGAHDAYIETASDMVKAANDAREAMLSNLTNMSETYGEMYRSGYCQLEVSPTTVCGEVDKLCGQVKEFVDKTNADQSYGSEARRYYQLFQQSMDQGEPNWEYWARGIMNVEDVVAKAKEISTTFPLSLMTIESKVREARNRVEVTLNWAGERIEDYEEQEYDQIDTLAGEGIVKLGEGVSYLFRDYKEKYGELSTRFSQIGRVWDNKESNYIYETCSGLTEIDREAPQLKADLEVLERDAESTVAYWRNEALRLIEMGSEMGLDMTEAVEAYKRGELAHTLGEKYVAYLEAHTLATLILATATEENNETLNSEEVQELLAYVRSLIERAKQDGIDVSEEEARLELALNNPDENIVISTLLDIKRSIVEKASVAYSDLPGLREEVYRYINTDPEFFQSIRWEVESAEAGVVVNGYIDYEKGLGKLHILRQTYQEALRDILEMIKGIGILDGDFYVDVPNVVAFNEEVPISIFASFYNPYPFEVDGEVEKEMPLPLDFSIQGEKISVRGIGTTAEISYSLGPFEGDTLNEEVSKVLGTLSEVGESKYGDSGVIYVSKDYVADVLTTQPTYLLPVKGTVWVNGKKVGFTDRVAGSLLGGSASISVGFESDKGYTWERGEITIVEKGSYREVSYEIRINNPEEGLEYLTIPLLKDEEDSSFDAPYLLEVEEGLLKISNPPAGEIVVEVTDTLPLDPKDELEDRLDDLEEDAKDEGVYEDYKDEFEDIQEDIEEGNYDDAMEKMNDLEEKLEQEKKDREKYMPIIGETLDSIEEELALVEEALGAVKGEDPYGLKGVFEKRKDELEKLKGEIESLVADRDYRRAYEKAKEYSQATFVRSLLQLAKDMKKEKDDLMKDYYKAKVDVEEVNELAQAFERTYSRVRTGIAKDYKALVEMEGLLVKLREKVEEVLKNKDKLKSEEEKKYEEEKEKAEELLQEYEEYYKKAKELGLEEYFARTPDYYKKKIASLPTGSQAALKYSSAKLAELRKEMEESIKKIEELAKEKAKRAFALYNNIRDRLDPNVRAKADAVADELQRALNEGNYVLALAKAEELLKLLSKVKIKKSTNPLVLLIVAAVALGGAALYMGGKGGFQGISLPFKGKEKEKKLRKLRRGSEELPPNSL